MAKKWIFNKTGLKKDTENYFLLNYCPLDKEAAQLTGCKKVHLCIFYLVLHI